ncbi:MAG: TetR/AcrR family transcriptional regulator C-terminal domain-containing protein [Micromonosporaceae bacterium]
MAATDTATTRGRLDRQQVLQAALDYADRNGLDALSMHKLGAALGVKAMSLYNHVANKEDLLAGVVDLLWSRVALPAPGTDTWAAHVRALAHSLREVIGSHPHLAPLFTSGQTLSTHSMRVAEAYRAALVTAGLPEPDAVGFLRTVTAYAIGQTLAELTWSQAAVQGDADQLTRIRQVTNLLPPDASDDLIRTALWFCADCDLSAQFELGIDLMIRGLEATLAAER